MNTAVLDDLRFYRAARLRPGVHTAVADAVTQITYRGLSLELEHSANARAPLSALFVELENGLPTGRLVDKLGDFLEPALEVLSALDRYGLLTDAMPAQPGAFMTGSQLWREVDALACRVALTQPRPFSELLLGRSATRAQLISYVSEYFHVVRMGSRIAAAALANTRPELVKQLEAFLAGEIGHEKMLAVSLRAVGIDAGELAEANPMPETFAIIGALQVTADQEPLSFAASLFLVERANPDFHEAFVACATALGLPDKFWRPLVAHAGLNDEGDHGEISRQLLEQIAVVSHEEAVVVKKQVVHLLDALCDLDAAIAKIR